MIKCKFDDISRVGAVQMVEKKDISEAQKAALQKGRDRWNKKRRRSKVKKKVFYNKK